MPNHQINQITRLLRPLYPKPRTALHYQTPFQLLVAVILSAQCTDKKVNEVTQPIFAKYKTAQDFARIPLARLAKMVRPTGFYVSKAKAVSVTAKLVTTQFGGRVPLTMEELLTLRGVARKTANVVLGELTGKAPGIVVDTHVRRLSQRLGLTTQNDPVKIERELMEIVPQQDWVVFPHLLILHGRSICDAKKPKCDECVLKKICPSAFTFPHFQTPKETL
ncbi:MAG: endonuclease III [Candidatus Kerfeldbacteria bacterium]|nr:endonuclease III [Candidatus Kerfeldbacteria bacterium]